ncbi:MAG: AAA family ATPase [Pirellulales bacterium]
MNNSVPETACLAGMQRREPPFVAETRRFLGRQELVAKRAKFPEYDLPQLHQAIAACFPDWQLAVEGGAPESRTGLLWVPEIRRMLIAPCRWAEYAQEATRFFRLPDGGRRVLAIDQACHPGFSGLSVRLFAPRSQQSEVGGEFTALLARMARPHYLQGQVIKPDAEILADLAPCTWDDVALDAGVRQAIEQNTVDVLRRREAFKRHGVPLKRGILLHGPPGTGKTLLAKVLAGLKLATFLYVTDGDMGRLDDVRDIFELARKLAPTILFFEDLDFFAAERSYFRGGVLGEILAQLDGFEISWQSVFNPLVHSNRHGHKHHQRHPGRQGRTNQRYLP